MTRRKCLMHIHVPEYAELSPGPRLDGSSPPRWPISTRTDVYSGPDQWNLSLFSDSQTEGFNSESVQYDKSLTHPHVADVSVITVFTSSWLLTLE